MARTTVAIVLAALALPASAAAVPRPAVKRFRASPATAPATGGTLRLRATVSHAGLCGIASDRHVTGLPTSKSCRRGGVQFRIKVPRNTKRAALTSHFTLTAYGVNNTKAKKRITVVQRAAAPPPVAAPAPPPPPPAITTQPDDATTLPGGSVSFLATANDAAPQGLRWQVSRNGGASWQDIPGATSIFLEVRPLMADDGSRYRAVFTNASGSTASRAATLSVRITLLDFDFQAGYTDVRENFAHDPTVFTAVTASWQQPAVTCPPTGHLRAAFWAGIGYKGSVVQDGTTAYCDDGVARYAAFFELYGDPDPAVNHGLAIELQPSKYPLAPGDAITATVSITGFTWTLAISNHTQHWDFAYDAANTVPGLNQGTVTVVAEGPTSSNPVRLANFGTIHFTGSRAVLNGREGSLWDFYPGGMEMRTGDAVRATPGPLSRDGDFTVTWRAS